MFLSNLRIFNFKNHAEVELAFDAAVTCVVGNNGSGKTNVLDAIYYLAFSKSAFNPYDVQNIRHQQQAFFLRGRFTAGGKVKEVECALQAGGKKVLREDGLDYQRFSEHVGKYPVVLIAPQDIELIWDGAELRRKFVDAMLSQTNRTYLLHLINYTHSLKQRNGLLRNFSESGRVDKDLLETYNTQLVQAGNYLHEQRAKFSTEFEASVKAHYAYLADNPAEDVGIRYRSDLTDKSFSDLLAGSLPRDIALQRTTTGIHRDDFLFQLNDFEIRRVGSQGQQKSLLVALKLSEFQILYNVLGVKPILLLDDIFDKLDDFRIQKLINLITAGTFGQLFITDARPERTRQILHAAQIKATVFHIENGTFTQAWLRG